MRLLVVSVEIQGLMKSGISCMAVQGKETKTRVRYSYLNIPSQYVLCILSASLLRLKKRRLIVVESSIIIRRMQLATRLRLNEWRTSAVPRGSCGLPRPAQPISNSHNTPGNLLAHPLHLVRARGGCEIRAVGRGGGECGRRTPFVVAERGWRGVCWGRDVACRGLWGVIELRREERSGCVSFSFRGGSLSFLLGYPGLYTL
ncbi:hypothetical protein DFP72DRAFT_895022 [Ephemerocybe angulata]|uniref:Uncharacterized protein n=1 Tax=Ephemerocybe angulata TaxID=980116 RepID=A0A8H6I2M5_9AGAR|nr:hypothetical protein DFP72DRAFT_895022 [Tulosesus angulatus]